MASNKFAWGQVVAVHKVKGIEVIEFHPWKRDRMSIHHGVPDTDEVEYHGYVDGKDTSQSWGTFDEALAGCIAFRHTGGTIAGHFFMKMLAADE